MPVQGAWARACRGVLVSLSSEVGVGELTARIAGLAVGEALTIVEFQASEVRRWQIRIDGRGTPRATCESIGLAALRRDGVLSEPGLDRFLAPGDLRQLLIAGSDAGAESPEADYAWRLARRRYSGASLLEGSAASVDEQLGDATARVPLSQRYELCLLERDRSGRLHVSPQRLFERGAKRGDTRTIRVYCEPSGPAGTTFAVMARDGAGYTGLVSMATAKVDPGPHTVTATLQRPGKVSFGGLGVPLRQDTRKWADVRAAVPERLGGSGPVNLILAVEICGSERLVAAHLDRAAQLAGNVASSAEGPVSFSLLAYGAHPHNLRVDDDPVAVLAWTEPYQPVLAQLSVLRRQAVDRPDHYTRAANIECMLGQAAGLLRNGHGGAGNQSSGARPVLVTVGSRVPFPAWRDPVTEILPCPGHNDWRGFLQRLKGDHPRMTFGAICGGDSGAEAWRLLGADATADLIVLDAWQFATDLRLLRPPGEHVPFPLVDR
jgi:hypothetical protein